MLRLEYRRVAQSGSGEFVLQRKDCGGGAGADAEFGQDVADVPVHGPFAEVELGSDLRVGLTVDDQP